ncbi:MAG: hypothetical protein HC915_20545 [Anaerolineae bacterium]|nr:hypothetical protein [Anaerolineae bacterium]
MKERLMAIAAALKQLQTEGTDGNFAILAPDDGRRANHYVQVAGGNGDSALYAEASGFDLDEAMHARLQSLGWEEACPTMPFNFWRRTTPGASKSQGRCSRP